jgi:DNA-binding NarL/FixJ family response regulator
VTGVETRLEGALARYVLPEPPDGHALRESIRASLRLLDVAPDRVSVPLLAATYRAVLRASIATGSITVAARELDIAEATARQHLSGLYRRTGCLDAAQAAYLLGAVDTR